MTVPSRLHAPTAFAALALALTNSTVHAATLPVAAPSLFAMHSFTGQPDGVNPSSAMVGDLLGNLYGTTAYGGPTGNGSVFRISPALSGGKVVASYRVIYDPASDGVGQPGPLAAALDGSLYFATSSFPGKVVRLTPPSAPGGAWGHSVVWTFNGWGDGYVAYGAPFASWDGSLVVATNYGGPTGNGALVRLSPPVHGATAWTETVLHAFAGGTDGAYPVGGPVMDVFGAIYGVTSSGGFTNADGETCGTVYRVAPAYAPKPYAYQVIYSFEGSRDGCAPTAQLTADPGGTIFGTTTGQDQATPYGTAFALAPPTSRSPGWALSTIWTFTGSDSLGGNPVGALVEDLAGNLYGAAAEGYYASGTVFRLSPPQRRGSAWSGSALWTFHAEGQPLGGVTGTPLGIVGTTGYGGTDGFGEAFWLEP
jgi:uncharacterized repeat protein (TIGR03803 family)